MVIALLSVAILTLFRYNVQRIFLLEIRYFDGGLASRCGLEVHGAVLIASGAIGAARIRESILGGVVLNLGLVYGCHVPHAGAATAFVEGHLELGAHLHLDGLAVVILHKAHAVAGRRRLGSRCGLLIGAAVVVGFRIAVARGGDGGYERKQAKGFEESHGFGFLIFEFGFLIWLEHQSLTAQQHLWDFAVDK